MRTLGWTLVAALLSVQSAAAQESATPTFLLNGPGAKRDVSSFAVRQFAEIGVSYSPDESGDWYAGHAAYTYFLSDWIDIKAHGAVGVRDSSNEDRLVAGGIGVAFWPTANWSLTPMASVGYQKSELEFYAWWAGYSYTVDVTLRTITAQLTSEFSLPLGGDAWVLATNSIAHHDLDISGGLSGSTDFQTATHLLAVDAPLGGDDRTTYRVRTTLGLSHDLSDIEDRAYSVAASIRSSNTKTRVDGWKAGFTYIWAPDNFDNDQYTFSLSHQF